MKRYLRVDEVAEILNCSKREVYRLATVGELQCFLIGKRRGLRVASGSLETFIIRRIEEFEQDTDFFVPGVPDAPGEFDP